MVRWSDELAARWRQPSEDGFHSYPSSHLLLAQATVLTLNCCHRLLVTNSDPRSPERHPIVVPPVILPMPRDRGAPGRDHSQLHHREGSP